MAMEQSNLSPQDQMNLKVSPFIRQMLKIEEENTSSNSRVLPTDIFYSCIVNKIDKYGKRYQRLVMITPRYLYSMSQYPLTNNIKINRQIPIKKMEAITTCLPTLINNSEMVIHLKDGYDFRFEALTHKEKVIKLIVQLSQLHVKAHLCDQQT